MTKKHLNRYEKIELLRLKKEKKIRDCRENFWEFCKTLSPVFKNGPARGKKLFRDDVKYLKELAQLLQDLAEDKIETEYGICISMPPRHAKSYMVEYFNRWMLAKYPDRRFGYISYSQDLVNKFSRAIRDDILKPMKGDMVKITYYDIFPELKMSKESRSVKSWSLEGMKYTMNTGSFRTPITGIGIDGLLIIDDPVKNSEEATSENCLLDKWNLFTDTIISRLEAGGKMIIIQTRWSKDDIVGKIKSHPEWGSKFKYIEMSVIQNEDELEQGKEPIMLNPDIMDYKQYIDKKSIIGEMIFYANYHQRLIDSDQALYKNIRFWDKLKTDDKGKNLPYKKVGVIDPSADGSDYTVVVSGYMYGKDEIYIDNIFYDNRNIVDIQDKLINHIISSGIEELVIETNGAFILLKDNIEKKLKEKGHKCKITSFKQDKNKVARITTASLMVQQQILWHKNSNVMFKEAFEHFKNFKMNVEGNKHDDLEDAITLLWEKFLSDKFKNKIESWENRYYL